MYTLTIDFATEKEQFMKNFSSQGFYSFVYAQMTVILNRLFDQIAITDFNIHFSTTTKYIHILISFKITNIQTTLTPLEIKLVLENDIALSLIQLIEPILFENLEIIVDELKTLDKLEISSDIQIKIVEDALTAPNFLTIMNAISQLHTKCWLIAKNRLADLIKFTQTQDIGLSKEANLVIVKVTHNSPADIKFNVNTDISVQGIAEALKVAIDAFSQKQSRFDAAELENRARELEIKIREQEAYSATIDKAQTRQIEAQAAELEKQKTLLGMEKQKLELEKQQLELQKERFEIETMRINYALETAKKMVDLLHPNTDEQTKAMILQTLIPNLLQLGNGKGLELVDQSKSSSHALPAPKEDQTNKTQTLT